MHNKEGIKAQNILQRKKYFTSAMSVKCHGLWTKQINKLWFPITVID